MWLKAKKNKIFCALATPVVLTAGVSNPSSPVT